MPRDTAYATEPATVTFAELDRVTLLQDARGDEGDLVPSGSTGTVVGIWAGGSAYEVEFSGPVSVLATVGARAIVPVRRR